MTLSLNYIRKKMGWCPNTAMMQTAAVLPSEKPEIVHNPRPDGGGKRIARGAGIATRSIKTLFSNRKLLWYPLLAGLVILFMFAAELLLMIYSGSYSYWSLGYKTGLVLTFAIEIASIFGLNLIMAGIVLCLYDSQAGPATVRKGLSLAKCHLKPVAEWSFLMALAGTAVYTILVHHPYYNHLYPAFVTATLSIPFLYYIPGMVSAAISQTFTLMFINAILLTITLFVIPGIVLGKRDVPGAAKNSLFMLSKTWIETAACIIVFGLILLWISLFNPLIQMTPAFTGYDYHFFAVHATAIAAVCIIFLLCWWAVVTVVYTVAGIAVTDLYKLGNTVQPEDESVPEGNT
ncbi:MAG: hypothetical protein JW931_00300 [Methanomicrobiaceae archaeon]|nr:hypothetical protein [Methanomicrobiaceae archaeon]